MNNADGDGQIDVDTEQGKSDVLRAKDIIPPLKITSGAEAVSDESGQSAAHPPAGAETSLQTGHRRSEIPRFNLAEEIMAEQRRITAVRRRGPGQTDEAQKQVREAESVGDKKEQMSAELSEQEEIIAEIVARDIERLCRGDDLRLHNV